MDRVHRGPGYDFLVVGAGFAGSVCARRLAEGGKTVLMIDSRAHVGGNAYDKLDDAGVLVHPYGPHIFHTNSKRIIEFLSQFTTWKFYEHRVLAEVDGQRLPIPINLTTLNKLYGLRLTEDEASAYLEGVRVPIQAIKTSEDLVLNAVGHDLCDKFFRGYTRKQWGLDLSELSASVAARIPTRTNEDDRYFTDTYQFMPANGYTCMFENMLRHPNIEVRLETNFEAVRGQPIYRHLVFTGPIDSFYHDCFGKLPYRSLRFEHEHLAGVQRYQPVGSVNFPNSQDYTRITEFTHLTGQIASGTSIVREYPMAEGDPYYPIPRAENEAIFKRYEALAARETHVSFVGRLAQYKYYNMDQVVGAALACAQGLIND